MVGVAAGFGGFTSWHTAGLLSEHWGSPEVIESAAAPATVAHAAADPSYRRGAISASPATAPDPVAAQAVPGGQTEAGAAQTVIHQPTRVEISAIEVDAPLVSLGLDEDGALEAPSDFAAAGWWQGGAKPGEAGPAVIAGHVDSYNGPAVFFSLKDLEPGDDVTVQGEDGTTLTFRVDRVEQHPKNNFPTQRVYGPTAEPTLRLITCGGSFDPAHREYSDNLIVYAKALHP